MELPAMPVLNRRRTLALLGSASVAALWREVNIPITQAASPFACVTAPPETEGPYFVEEMLNRSDIRIDPTDGSVRPGVLLTLAITVHQVGGTGCATFPGAHVEVWHCDAGGTYSDERANNTTGRKYLRGYQVTDANGVVNFTTIYPGWYSGRTVHIHFKVRTYSGSSIYDEFTSQLYFDDAISDEVFAQSPYSGRGTRNTRNSNDMVLGGTSNPDLLMLDLTKTGTGYAATIDIGVNLKSVAAAKPSLNANGLVSAASFEAGAAPGAWVSIFGQNLATASRSLTSSDIVNGTLPVALGGASVRIDGKPAYLAYVSPTQINALAPATENTGTVEVIVTNAAGTSAPVSATLQAVQPAFFQVQNYVAAVRADGVLITGTGGNGTVAAAKPGDAGIAVRDRLRPYESGNHTRSGRGDGGTARKCRRNHDRRRARRGVVRGSLGRRPQSVQHHGTGPAGRRS